MKALWLSVGAFLLLAGCSSELRVHWGPFEVEVVKSNSAEGGDLLRFIETETGAVRMVVEADRDVIQHGVFPMANDSGYGVVSHSGGESGGFLTVMIFFLEDKNLRRVDLPGFSGANSIAFEDVDGDGTAEIVARSEAFSGYLLSHGGQVLTLVKASYEGGLSLLPEIYSWLRDEEGDNVVQTTFEPTSLPYLKKKMDEVKVLMEPYRGKTLEIYPQDDEFLVTLISYYHYLSRLSGLDAAEMEALKDGISVRLPDGSLTPLARALRL